MTHSAIAMSTTFSLAGAQTLQFRYVAGLPSHDVAPTSAPSTAIRPMAGVPLALGEREADPSTWFPLQEAEPSRP